MVGCVACMPLCYIHFQPVCVLRHVVRFVQLQARELGLLVEQQEVVDEHGHRHGDQQHAAEG